LDGLLLAAAREVANECNRISSKDKRGLKKSFNRLMNLFLQDVLGGDMDFNEYLGGVKK